ncbi:Teneurin-3 [Liparis tanakae]|uniref:Teneurin-3 n=1 Tax=Liparis tanakae TaxID=230148 RepID=A0A4Z2I0S7_9TELE|nr:Teneurin-3 [Liparis tanakae]
MVKRDHLSCQQGPPPLPPAPPPHKQHPSITSLSRSSLANQRSPSPPPTAGLATDLQSTAECVQLQDSWVLGSNVALESRRFLFKTGTGTTPFFGAAAPGYTMATGTVYSTPARPLPRNSQSRGAFKFKKSPKHCSWKCTALIAVGIAVVLSIILCYCIEICRCPDMIQQRLSDCKPLSRIRGHGPSSGSPNETAHCV